MSTPSKLASAIALTFVLAPSATIAGQLDYSLYGGVAHSDNINLTAHDPISQTMLIPGVNFTYNQQGEDLQAKNKAGAFAPAVLFWVSRKAA